MSREYKNYIFLFIVFSLFLFYQQLIGVKYDFEKKILFHIKVNTFLGIEKKIYSLSNYIDQPFDGIIFYTSYDDEFYKFRLFNDIDQIGIQLKLHKNGELTKNQLLINTEKFKKNDIYAFKCKKINSYIFYIGYNDILKSYDFYPIGCEIIYK